jgi:aspartyl-tRNA(Asn)/glutamyl-tRNA(Gln) amidotransferase subunit B
MRSKEDALDYRYQPEPDLLPLALTDDQYADLAQRQNIDLTKILTKLTQTYGFHKEYTNVLISQYRLYQYFETLINQ